MDVFIRFLRVRIHDLPHTYAIPAFDPRRTSEYYIIHEELDCRHENRIGFAGEPQGA